MREFDYKLIVNRLVISSLQSHSDNGKYGILFSTVAFSPNRSSNSSRSEFSASSRKAAYARNWPRVTQKSHN